MFYTIRIQKNKSDVENRKITPFETITEAEIYYHRCLATDMENKDNKSVLVCVMSEVGNIMYSRYWVADNEMVEDSEVS